MEALSERLKELKALHSDDIEHNSSGYNLQADIGSGTFGQVKLATHIDTDISVAIKVLNKAEIRQNDDFQRVAREFDILVKVDHPNVIYMYEVTLIKLRSLKRMISTS
jgi:serine/threonine protein kinase